jgi:NAD(P)-dependent dehydrogenase (short-subunit alcohol dehydrogenase family)
MTKTILITGAGRGIGRAAAVLAGARGWNVAVNFLRNAEAARDTAAEVERQGGRAVCVQADVAREADVLRLFDATVDAFGTLDGLVNNAGVVGLAQPLVAMSAERIEAMLRTNLLSAYLCAREAARRMSPAGGGRGGAIVNVSSLAARTGAPGEYVDYAGAKAAMDAMTLGLSKEAGPDGIRVNSVRPAFIDTEIHAMSGNPERARVLGATTPLGREGRPSEVGELIVWLLSDAASYVTGAVIDVAGGK